MWDIRKVIVALFLASLVGVDLAGSRQVFADALQYSLEDLGGEVQSLEQYSGKWVIVNFWATWCGPCIREIPELKKSTRKKAQKNNRR